MMNVLIVEDEILASERLRELILKYNPHMRILDCIDTVSGTLDYLQNHLDDIDLIFLDIQLADGRSFEIFKDYKVLIPVIFITAYDEFAMKAFELNSIDYLMKPVSSEKLNAALDKFMRLSQNSVSRPAVSPELARQLMEAKSYKQRFLVRSGNRILFRETDEIAYFFAQDKSCFLVENTGAKYLIDSTLDQLQDQLDPHNFFRINRSIIIHIPFIREVRTHLGNRLKIIPETVCKEDMTVSRSRVSDFKNWLDK